MKTAVFLFFLLLMYATASKAGLPPTNLKGQEDASSKTTFFFQAPNKQATQTAASTGLIETGNKNLLADPSFEGISPESVWSTTGTTASSGVLSGSSANIVHGKSSYYFTASSQVISLVQSSTSYAAAFADGVQGLASVMVKTNHTGTCSVCSVNNSTVSTTNCVTVQANNKWGLYKVPFILGATNNGISLACTSGTGTTYVDDAFVGAVDLQASVDQSRIAGESYFAGTANCQWTRTSTTVGAFGTDADCPGPTVAYSSMGSWQTTDSDLPRQTINNLPAGVYKAKFIVANNLTAAAAAAITINDGTTTCEPIFSTNSNSVITEAIISCTFTYTQAGNRVFELYGASGAGSTLTIYNSNTTPRTSTKFILEYFGSGSVYTSTNADTDWASCNFSSLAWQGLGTVTSNLQCKREGGDLLMRGVVTLGTVSSSEARIPLPLWNGVQLTNSQSGYYGFFTTTNGTLNRPKNFTTFSTSTGLNYINVGVAEYAIAAGGSATLLGNTYFSNGDLLIPSGVLRIPISGWTNSNIIIGQFNGLESCTDTLECTDTFSAKVSSTGVVSDENVDWISGNCTNANPSVCTFRTGIFTVAPNCTVSGTTGNNTTIAGTATSTTLTITSITDGGALSSTNYAVNCQKQGADYIGKTAKAVASDQNIATPGVTKVKACYYAFGGASATLASPTECTSGTCTEVVDTCGTGSAPAYSSAGLYTNFTFANGTFANNTPVMCTCTGFRTTTASGFGCFPYFETGDQTWSSNSSGGYVTNISMSSSQNQYVIMKCEGQAP